MRQTANAKRRTGSNFFERALNAIFPEKKRETVVVDAGQELPSQDDKKTRAVFKRILYAVISLLLATILWGYVLMTQNPDREKTFTDITPSFESGAEADLYSRKLAICDLEDVLKQVSVTVSAPLTEISKIRENNINATISMSEVHSTGTYSLEIRATSTIGSVVSVEPDHVEVTIEDYMNRMVPINYSFVGELPEAYWHDEPLLSPSTVTLEGARSDIEKVSGAVCYIDLNGVTSSISRSMQLTIIDGEGGELDSSIVKNVIPAVTVNMTVLPHKHVNIEYEILDRDMLSDFYEIQSETLSVTSIDVAAEPDVLAGIETFIAMPISVGGIEEARDYTYPLTLTNIPPLARVVDGTDRNNIQLTVTVVDRYITQTFHDIPIEFMNESPDYLYTYESETVDMDVYGPARLVTSFVTSDVTVSVNLQRRGAGEYELMIEFKPLDVDSISELEITFPKQTLHVSVSPKSSAL